jgi:hypothetical protein
MKSENEIRAQVVKLKFEIDRLTEAVSNPLAPQDEQYMIQCATRLNLKGMLAALEWALGSSKNCDLGLIS